MTAKVILNPYAGRWQARERKDEAEQALREAGIEFDLEVTAGPGHAIELANQASKQGFNPIIAAGGDGTYNEVVNGIAQATDNDGSITFGVLPFGNKGS